MKQKKIKALQISLRADLSGGPKHLNDLLEELSAKDKVEFFGAYPKAQDLSKLLEKGTVDSINLPHRFFSFKKYLELFSFCKNKKIDIIHSHGRGAGVYSRLLKFTGAKIIHTFHGIHHQKTVFGRLKIIMDRCLRFLTDRFIFVSPDEMEEGLSYKLAIPKKSRVILNGVDEQKIKIVSQQASNLSKSFSFPKNKIIVGLLGRITYQKGHDLLIEILNKNPHLFSEYFFVIAGRGEDDKKILNMIQKYQIKNVIMIGETKTPYSFLNNIDIYLSTSRWEGLPLTVLEALALNKPCLLSDVQGHRDVREYVTLFDTEEPLQLLEGLKNVRKMNHFPEQFKRYKMAQSVLTTYINERY